MSVLRVCSALLFAGFVAGCAVSQSGSTAASSNGNAAQVNGVAAALNINVTNTILRVADLNDEGALRRELEEFKAGLYWSRGLRPTDAVIEIIGEGSTDGVRSGAIASNATDRSSTFGISELYGTVSLLDAATGAVVIEPIFISVSVGDDRDARTIGLTTGTKAVVELEYLVQKFMLAGREALYGKGN